MGLPMCAAPGTVRHAAWVASARRHLCPALVAPCAAAALSQAEAYALTAFEAAAAPDGYITKLAGGGRTYLVYVHRRAACWAAAPAQKPHSGGRWKPDACRDCVATARAATWALG